MNKLGIIRITKETPDSEAIAALIRALFAFSFARRDSEFTEVVFRNRSVTPVADEVIVITPRTPDPTKMLIMALRSAWARLNANQKITVKFEIDRIAE